MAQSELVEQSEVFYYALITSRAVSVLADFRRNGILPPDSERIIRQCYELMKKILKGQRLVETRSGRIVPDLESIQVYQHMQGAMSLQDFGSGKSIGQVADEFASTLKAILDGKRPFEIGEEPLLCLEKAISALASVYVNETAVSTLTRHASSLLQWPSSYLWPATVTTE